VAIRFTERELDIMAVLWQRGPATASEVREALSEDGLELAYNTVQTLLRILEGKGYVTHTEEDRAHRFHVTVERAAAGESVIDRVIDKLFGGSAGVLATELVNRRRLDPVELRELRDLLDQQLRAESKGRPRRKRSRRSKEGG
jgi:BlaI family penicillinase repressor